MLVWLVPEARSAMMAAAVSSTSDAAPTAHPHPPSGFWLVIMKFTGSAMDGSVAWVMTERNAITGQKSSKSHDGSPYCPESTRLWSLAT